MSAEVLAGRLLPRQVMQPAVGGDQPEVDRRAINSSVTAMTILTLRDPIAIISR
jgi:hypothetical protein